jgi:hypothetical protein
MRGIKPILNRVFDGLQLVNPPLHLVHQGVQLLVAELLPVVHACLLQAM